MRWDLKTGEEGHDRHRGLLRARREGPRGRRATEQRDEYASQNGGSRRTLLGSGLF
jgi:hypothetical protein